MMKVTFDGGQRLVLVVDGVTELDVREDIYSYWKSWKLQGDNGKYLPALRVVGGDPTTGGLSLGATFFLVNGWRIRSWEGDHRLLVNGNLYTEEGESPYVPILGPYTTAIEGRVSNLIDRIGSDSASGIAQEVWATPQAQTVELAAKILRNKTVTDPTTGQMIVFDDDGETPLLVAALFEDVGETQPYRGRGAEVRERLA